jgi:hypothetical protein
MPSRRRFLDTCLKAGLALPAAGLPGSLSADQLVPVGRALPDPRPPRTLLDRLPDLKRRFVFEYYPWYGGPPEYVHWNSADRVPPHDLAATSYPLLGAYDSRSRTVVERHARWIADAGVGSVNLSWWGVGGFEDRAVHTVMDVMRDHDLKVTFHLEPYGPERGARFLSDVLHLLREYGEKRRYDALLLLKGPGGREGPLLKGFATILPPTATDCHGVTRPVPEYTTDDTWRRANDDLRSLLRRDFDQITLLADSAHYPRVQASGFDGVAFYDPFVRPDAYRPLARQATAAGLVFSFSVNPGVDAIRLRHVAPDSCYTPLPFEPPTTPPLDWPRPEERERAARIARERIVESFRATLAVQTDPTLLNVRREFFLVYITSFNEWHEGTQFEPMKDDAELTPEERAVGYHNPADGSDRLRTLATLVAEVLSPPVEAPTIRRP